MTDADITIRKQHVEAGSSGMFEGALKGFYNIALFDNEIVGCHNDHFRMERLA